MGAHRQTDIHMDRPLNHQAVRYRQLQTDKPLQQFAGKLRLRLRPRLFIRRVSRQCQDRFATDDGFSGRDDYTYSVQHHNTVINNNQPGRQPEPIQRERLKELYTSSEQTNIHPPADKYRHKRRVECIHAVSQPASHSVGLAGWQAQCVLRWARAKRVFLQYLCLGYDEKHGGTDKAVSRQTYNRSTKE